MAHAVHVDLITKQAVALLGAGAEITVQDALDDFDAALHSEPKRSSMSPEMDELRRALGV